MRIIKVLAQKTTTALNEFDFRNANEVLKFLDGVKELTDKADKTLEMFMASAHEVTAAPTQLKQFIVGPKSKDLPVLKTQPGKTAPKDRTRLPGKSDVEENFSVLQEYLRQREMVQSLDVRVRSGFAGSRKLKLMLETIKERAAQIDAGIAKARNFIEKVANKNVPKEVSSVFSQVVNPIVRQLKGRYKKIDRTLQVNTFQDKGRSVLQFTHYTHLTELKRDDGFVYHDIYFVVVCCILNDGTHVYYVDVTFQFEAPSTEPLESGLRGSSFTRANAGLRLLQAHLKADEQLDLLAPDHLPIKESDTKIIGLRVAKLIKSNKVDEDAKTLKVTLVNGATENDRQKVITTVLADIASLTSMHNVKEKLKYLPNGKPPGQLSVTFWFSVPLPRKGIQYRDNMAVLRQLKEHLGLDDAAVKKIGRVLRSHEPTNQSEDLVGLD